MQNEELKKMTYFFILMLILIIFSDLHFWIIHSNPKYNIFSYKKILLKQINTISFDNRQNIKFHKDYLTFFKSKQSMVMKYIISSFVILFISLFINLLFYLIIFLKHYFDIKQYWKYFLFIFILWLIHIFNSFYRFKVFIDVKKIILKINNWNDNKEDKFLFENNKEEIEEKMFQLFEKKKNININYFENFDFNFVIKILKLTKSFEEFSNEFYFLIICNYDQIIYNNQKFKLSNYVWLWTNRKLVYDKYFQK